MIDYNYTPIILMPLAFKSLEAYIPNKKQNA